MTQLFSPLAYAPASPGWGANDRLSDCIRAMNRKRELHEKLDVLLESGQAEVAAGILDVLHQRVMADGE